MPALVLLVIMAPLRVPLQWHDGWAFVQQYQDWVEGRYSWREFFAPHNGHPSAVGKTIYFIVLHWLHGNVALLPFLSWVFSLVISVCVALLARPLWAGNRVLGAALMFGANLTIFSAAQGHAWIWDFVFQNWIPGMCLAVGALILSTGSADMRRIVPAGILSVIATFSFGSGCLVGILFSLLIWRGLRERTIAQKCAVIAMWLAFACAEAWIAHNAFGKPAAIASPLDRPAMRLEFVLIVLGRMLGDGTVFDPEMVCAAIGGALVLAFAACTVFVFLRRHDDKLVSQSLPWIVCCLWGLANAGLISIGRMTRSLLFAMYPRYVTFSLFFVLGTFLLAAAVTRHGGRGSGAIRWMRRIAWPVLAVFMVVHVVNWESGWQVIKLYHVRMKQERAMLVFADLIPLETELLWNNMNNNSSARLARFLVEHDRLPGMKMVTDNRLVAFRSGGKISEKLAHFDIPVLLKDGRWKLGGVCELANDDSMLPDLVLITAESASNAEERIIALAAPLLPNDFFDGKAQRRQYPEHYFGWSQKLDPSAPPPGTITLRAYAFEHERWRLSPIDGVHKLEIIRK